MKLAGDSFLTKSEIRNHEIMRNHGDGSLFDDCKEIRQAVRRGNVNIPYPHLTNSPFHMHIEHASFETERAMSGCDEVHDSIHDLAVDYYNI